MISVRRNRACPVRSTVVGGDVGVIGKGWTLEMAHRLDDWDCPRAGGKQEVSGWNVLVYLPRSLYIVFVVQRLRVDCQFQISGRFEKTDIFYLAFQGFDELCGTDSIYNLFPLVCEILLGDVRL